MDNINIEKVLSAVRSAMMNQVAVSETESLGGVIDAYTLAKACVLSPHTLADYGLTLRRLRGFLPDEKAFSEIGSSDVRSFLATIPGGAKNRKNAHIALCALWTYAISENYTVDHVPRRVEVAKPEIRAIIPFSKDESRRMIETVRQSGRDKLRNESILLTLLDTGIRASELCGLHLGDIEGDFLRVLGKGRKERRVPVTPYSMKAIVAYLESRPAGKRNSPVFLSETGAALNRDSLRLLIQRIGDRSGVTNAHPHKFRHTFSINYLLNGGDPYTLQLILGHSTMDTVKRYLYLTNRDVSSVHMRASPLAKWNL